MSNVSAISRNVNPSVDEVVQWLEAKGACGDLPSSSVRLQVTALRAFAACVAPDEPKDDAAYVRDNLDKLSDRWSRLNTESKADTVRTYHSRAKSALALYFAWKENPSGFRFDKRPSSKKDDAPSKKAAPKEWEPAPPEPSLFDQVPQPAKPTSTFSHRFKVGSDKFVFFELPDAGITVAEWKRWVAHTYTLCEDFDPEEPSPIVSQSIIRG